MARATGSVATALFFTVPAGESLTAHTSKPLGSAKQDETGPRQECHSEEMKVLPRGEVAWASLAKARVRCCQEPSTVKRAVSWA